MDIISRVCMLKLKVKLINCYMGFPQTNYHTVTRGSRGNYCNQVKA